MNNLLSLNGSEFSRDFVEIISKGYLPYIKGF